ncbi:hypothetical protein KKC17_02265 [Patescibacteria group bacterium]|nr:hypothetical protein [Patescibacteria group bacterium]
MYLSRRHLIIIISSIVVLLIVVAILWQFKGQESPKMPGNQEITELDDSLSAITNNNSTIELPLDNLEATSSADSQQYARQAKARLFVEKFGSYSTDNPFANLISVADLTTPAYQSYLNSLLNQELTDVFYSVATRALAVEVLASQTNQATVLVSTQRQESKARDGEATIKYQAIELKMILINNDWLVNGAEWQ